MGVGQVVDSVATAITHVNEHGSHHTDAIVTENTATADTWVSPINSRKWRAEDCSSLQGNSTSDLFLRSGIHARSSLSSGWK